MISSGAGGTVNKTKHSTNNSIGVYYGQQCIPPSTVKNISSLGTPLLSTASFTAKTTIRYGVSPSVIQGKECILIFIINYSIQLTKIIDCYVKFIFIICFSCNICSFILTNNNTVMQNNTIRFCDSRPTDYYSADINNID